ncbi:MAG: hypothetical protein ACRCXT_15395 [Paraclostridium sp.]
MKIGQEIVIKEDFKINTLISDKVKTVKKGDTGFLDSKGFLHLITGNGKGKIVKVNDLKVDGYDYENISNLIFRRLNTSFNLEDFLINEGIESKYFMEEIEDLLIDIL